MLIKLLKPLSFIPAILLMYMIFSFSAQDGTASSDLSYKVSYTIVDTANTILDADLQPSEISALATRFNGVIRKLAHMTEYFALAIAVAFPLYVYGLHGLALMFAAGLFCVVFACGDEYHQSFVDGRSPSVRDVMIDSFGVFWGIILVRIVGWTGRKTIFRPFGKAKKQAKKETASASWDTPQNPYMDMPQGYRGSQYGAPYDPAQTGAPYGSFPDGFYGPSGQGSPQTVQKRKRRNHSDQLSEDMSLKNLIRNLRNGDEE